MSSKRLWIYIGVFMLFCVGVAHFIFQNYLYMRPCVQCIYIRYYMIIAGFGAIFIAIFYKQILLYIFGILVFSYGAICGLLESLKLNTIHQAIANANPFGVKGCLDRPIFELKIAWDEIMPSLFKATGQCGLDMPMVPTDIKLDVIQGYFVALYQDGWYLIPSLKLINMAQISIIIFSIALILGLILLILRLKGKKWLKY
ncbi:disulfide bond formation protein B [Campylobacter devanensis]|uniref:disulfide bond formation protein B n=1 Tax=Campylobacter devanensis TaxID=3161138 RepID=UPI000A354408|nr:MULTISPECIES: disulfide bond formation protein B [unclassified Campylobacter]